MDFRGMVREKKVKWPSHQGFSRERWDAAWNSSVDKEPAQEQLWKAGSVIYENLDEIRRELQKLYDARPAGLTDSQLLRLYCAISNRDAIILLRASLEEFDGSSNLFSWTYSKNKYGNELGAFDVAEACLDGFQKAIAFCIKRNYQGESGARSIVPNSSDVMSFIEKESSLSQLYGIYEELWRSLVWGNYTFKCLSQPDNAYEVRQCADDDEIAKIVSHTRRLRIAAAPFSQEMLDLISSLPNADRCIYAKRIGAKWKLNVGITASQSERLRLANTSYLGQVLRGLSSLPNAFISKEQAVFGFAIREVLEVLRQLCLLSNSLVDKISDDTSAFSTSSLSQFCPKFVREDLIRAISKVLSVPFIKIAKIISFLTYDGSSDIWSYPIVDLGGGGVGLLLAATVQPVPLRVAEHWLVKFGVELEEKGGFYEKQVVNALNTALGESPFVECYDPAVSINLKRDSRAEEIDVVMRVGSVILVGECKSIVSTDSATSYFSATKAIRKGAAQALRKAEFIKEDIEESFKQLGWKYSGEHDYEFVPVVINSNRMRVGFPMDGVAVSDDMILSSYFSSPIVPLFSISDYRGGVEHLAWFRMYDDFAALQRSLAAYLLHPPQVSLSKEDFRHKSIKLPYMSSDSPKFIVSNLFPKNVTLAERAARSHRFPFESVPDLDQRIKEVDFSI